MKNKKLKLAIIGFTSCKGCQFVILDLGKQFFNLLKEDFELVEMSLYEDNLDKEQYDLTIVEGSIVTKKDQIKIKEVRAKTKILIALGACACLGGVPEIKNYRSKNKLLKKVYRNIKGIDNPKIKPIHEFVKIDFSIPGCPPNNQEILEFLKQIRMGKIPKIEKRPVCFDCSLATTSKCFLKKGQMCLGPITITGCAAICPENNYPCEGCRGPLLDEAKDNVKNILRLFKGREKQKDIELLLEKYGIRDDVGK